MKAESKGALMDSSPTMDAIINGLGQLGASAPPETAEICKVAIRIIFAISEEGAKTPEDALDIIQDYRLQAKQYAALQKKHTVAGRPFLKDGVWHCPDCNGRCRPNHSFCHRCGKKLGWM